MTARNRIKMFADRQLNKDLVRLALPIAFQYLMLALVAVADAFMLGVIDADKMSAVSLATQYQFIENMILSSAISAFSILGAQYWGKKDRKTFDEVFAIGMRISGIVCILFFAGCFFFPRPLMFLFTNETTLIDIGEGYLKIASFSYLLTGISQCYLSLMKVTEHASPVAGISTTTVLLNILLNGILIFGWFGVPAMEERGAATATLISRIVELILCLIVLSRKSFYRPSFRALFRFVPRLEKDYYRCFLPLVGASLLWGIGFTSYSSFMGHLGLDVAAANSVTAVVRDLVCCLCNGLAAGGGVIIGFSLGRGELELGKTQGIRIAKMAFFCGFLSTLIMLIFTPALMAFVKLSDEGRKYLLWFMLVMAFYMIGRAVNTVVINGIFSAGGDTIFDVISLTVTMWGIAIPLAVLGTYIFHWSPVIVYACTCIDEVGKIPWVMYHFRKYKWVKDLTRERVLTDTGESVIAE